MADLIGGFSDQFHYGSRVIVFDEDLFDLTFGVWAWLWTCLRLVSKEVLLFTRPALSKWITRSLHSSMKEA
jgi:hypothetical protein